MANILQYNVADVTISATSQSEYLTIELVADAEEAEIHLNGTIYTGSNDLDPLQWSFLPISVNRSDYPGDGTYPQVVSAFVYAYRRKISNNQDKVISVVVEPVIGGGGGDDGGQGGGEPTSYPENTPTYYIDITANINQSLNYNGTSISFNGKTVTDKDNYQIIYSLPSASLTLDCGNIDANDINNLTLGSFHPTITITAYSNGAQTANVNITGSNILQTISENPTKAQKLYWGNTPPSISSTSADILSSLLTASKVASIFSTEINTLEQMFTHNVFSSWNFNILPVGAVAPPSYNVFDQYAYVNGREFPNIFQNGEYIVLETAHNYEIIVQDFNGVQQTIIPSTQIFARVTHNDMHPLLL